MKKVILYTEHNCPLCEDAKALLHILKLDYSFDMEERYIQDNDEWVLKYHLKVPVVEIDGREIYGDNLNFKTLDNLLQMKP